jgi:hypothetical protein
MRRRSFRKLFRMSPCVEGAEQRLSLSAVGVPTLNAPVAAQVDQGSRPGETGVRLTA